jgi:ATP-binding cassette subfamily B protein
VLRDMSFHLPACSLTALVGPSGSGKTTITKLITRYADPQRGAIKIGGVDIRAVTQTELMRHVSVVFQDVYLFDESIRDNIRMAKPDATDDEVMAAARAANCHEFISRLPAGYDTTVGEIGGALSGGERQRISIARAILKDAPIVLLDEPTSALDTESEVAMQRAIDRLVENKTVVVVAHRLSTVVAADHILVLEDGSIVEQGHHTDLLAANGRYAAMWAAQQQARRWKV